MLDLGTLGERFRGGRPYDDVMLRAMPIVLAVLSLGCQTISMHTVHTDERVTASRLRIVAGNDVRVRSRIDGTTLIIQTTRACDLVEMEEVEVTEHREALEEVYEEFAIAGIGAIPVGIGIGMIADAPNVYDNDRHSRLYNQAGPEGAYIGGTILTVAGGSLMLWALIEAGRVVSAEDQITSSLTRQGQTIEHNVTCEGAATPVSAPVVLEVSGTSVRTDGTSSHGTLALDLASAIPPELANDAVSVRVIVAGKLIGELDIEPILDEQARRQQPDVLPDQGVTP